MSKINNGGPAFPIPLNEGQPYQGHSPCNGMTLRDYFAAKAMQGLCVGRSHTQLKGHAKASADAAYEIADAMLRARGEA